jgi:hypothetical protein
LFLFLEGISAQLFSLILVIFSRRGVYVLDAYLWASGPSSSVSRDSNGTPKDPKKVSRNASGRENKAIECAVGENVIDLQIRCVEKIPENSRQKIFRLLVFFERQVKINLIAVVSNLHCQEAGPR